MEARGDRLAFGGPGIEPRWSHSNKEGVGTAYSTDSRLWFTLWRGIVTEVYYHRIDRPQMRDLQFLVSDGSTFFHEEKRDLATITTRPGEHALAYRTLAEAPGGGTLFGRTSSPTRTSPVFSFGLASTSPRRSLWAGCDFTDWPPRISTWEVGEHGHRVRCARALDPGRGEGGCGGRSGCDPSVRP